MKLFALVASALGLGHTVAQDTWQTPSAEDKKVWQSDVLGAASTAKDIKTEACKVPEGTDLRKLGDPTNVSKRYSREDEGNIVAAYQYKFADGSMVYAGNRNAGETGGAWQIYCYRAGSGAVVTKDPHDQNDLDDAMITRLESIFKSIDKDGSGTITTGGAYTGLSQIFPSYSIPDFENTLEKESIKAAGTDKVVDLDEFECVAKKLMNIQKVYNEFKQYDENDDLTMDRDELSDALIKYYFKEVAQPSLLETAAARAKVKTVVDDIITHHDKNGDDKVSWEEFEMDAFMEQHYSTNGQCRTSSDPLKEKSIAVVDGLIKKFKGDNKEMSHSMWYQIVNMLTEQAIDLANGSAPPPPLGCMQQMQTPGNNPNGGSSDGSTNGGPQRFGQNGGSRWGQQNTPQPGLLGGRRVLLARFLQGPGGMQQNGGQQNGGRGGFGGGRPSGSGMGPGGMTGGRPNGGSDDSQISAETRMTIMQALQALRAQADSNNDGMISDHEILDIFQGVKEKTDDEQFAVFLGAVDALDGPIDCESFTDCGSCTAVDNAGLCGWFPESKDTGSSNPFGGFGSFGSSSTASGTCKFVDRSMSYAANSDAVAADDAAKDTFQLETCSTQCRMSGGGFQQNGGGFQRPTNSGGNFRGSGGN